MKNKAHTAARGVQSQKNDLMSKSSLRPLGAEVLSVYIQQSSSFRSKEFVSPTLGGCFIASIPTYLKEEVLHFV